MTIKILLVDDHIIVRQGLRKLLESQKNFLIVAEAGDGVEAIKLVDSFHPDVTVLDIMMPGIGGLEVARQVQGKTRVVILSMHSNEAYVVEAIRNGALGYVLKDSQANELIQAIQAAYENRYYLGTPFSQQSVNSYLEKVRSKQLDPYETLTRREREVLKMTAEGLTAAEISEKLAISPRTVEVHRANAMHKLSLKSHSDLVRYAVRRGLLPLSET